LVSDRSRNACRYCDDGLLVVSPYVMAELDYLVAKRIGVDAELAILSELSSGAWELAAVGVSERSRRTR
jgi:uncharacterized protein